MSKNNCLYRQTTLAILGFILFWNNAESLAIGTSTPVARIALCTGDVQFSKKADGLLVQADLFPGDEVITGSNPDSRCRINYPSGSSVDVGPDTKLKFNSNQELSLVQGQIVAYAMPGLKIAEQPVTLETGGGELKLSMGKIFASAGKEKQQIAIFNDLVAATWKDKNGESTLYPGNLINLTSGSLEITQTPRTMEIEMSERVSPESPAVKLAALAFKNRDFNTARRLFTQIQQVYPYNAASAYHLGMFNLKDNRVPEAVEQWRKYVEIDPVGAKANGVTKQLSLMNTYSIKDEVKQAIANESKLSTSPPEPNSIAVNPLINKGEEKYIPIGKGLTAFIISDLMKVPGLKVLEREKLQTLIDEIKLSQSGQLVEKNSRLRADRIMRAEKLVIGDYLIQSDKEEGQ